MAIPIKESWVNGYGHNGNSLQLPNSFDYFFIYKLSFLPFRYNLQLCFQSKHARVALVDYCNSIHGDSFKIRILYNNLLQVLKDNARVGNLRQL